MSSEVPEGPHERLVGRLRELAHAVTQGREAVAREFTMRVPAEPERDADLVLSTAADEIERLRHALQVALPALENGAEALAMEADRYHAEMKGYRTAEHQRRDDEAAQAYGALKVVKAALSNEQTVSD
jgi:hypothetical protein